MNFQKILWAVDPDSLQSDINPIVSSYLKEFAKHKGCEICPVSILNLGDILFAVEYGAADLSSFKKKAQLDMKKILKKTDFDHLKGTLLTHHGTTMGDAAKTLLDHAKKIKADVIVIGAKNLKGIDKFLMGSFAETIMFTSKIPLLMVKPDSPKAVNFKSVFYCAEFAGSYKKIFKRLLDICRADSTKLTLFHYFGYGRKSKMPTNMKNLLSSVEENLHSMAKMGERTGVEVKISITHEEKDSITDAILEAAKKEKAQLIAIKGATDRLRTFFIGSTARKVLRKSRLPVLLLR